MIEDWKDSQERMLIDQLLDRGIRDPKVLEAFAKIPRHLFVPENHQPKSYTDHPLPIGCGQTISQPYMVALMTQELQVRLRLKVLEIGTGSGYQTAILSFLGASVFSIERFPELLEQAKRRLTELKLGGIHLRIADGSIGWPEEAPFDRIVAAAAAPQIPKPLLNQLADAGRMVLPIGHAPAQKLILVEKQGDRFLTREICNCVFVPLIGRYGFQPGEVNDQEADPI